MRAAIRTLALALLTLAPAAAAPAVAPAFYGHGAQIVSADFERLEQGDDATVFAAISGDGRYVAIQTQARNFFADGDPDPPGQYRAGGVFRFDMRTRTLTKVADGDLFDEGTGAFLRRGASNPSISADGRFVAFATAQPLLPADTNENVDVYVRDMGAPIGAAGAFDLVSARDGGDQPASYDDGSGSGRGADLTSGAAISADGQKVAFRTDALSDLPAAAAVSVPVGQVFLRDRAANRTTLVSARRDAESGQMTDQPAGRSVGAALSADGTTVVWTGNDAAAQTRFLKGESPIADSLYYLWRRFADSPGDPSNAPTRRVTGLADPDDPACPIGVTTFFNQTGTGPCYGPLTGQEATRANIVSQVPALSGDGYTVAFLTGEGPRPNAATGPGLDLFLTKMDPGLTRKQSTVELTRETVGNQVDTGPPLSSVALSSDGRYAAIATVRTRFALPALRLLGEPRQIPGPRELYVADLSERTLDRVTRAVDGGEINASVLNGPTLSADGERVAFAAFAGNLFFGDANQRADAFVAERQAAPGTAPPPAAPGAFGPAATLEESDGPLIRARARSRRGGLIVIDVSVPAAGGVRAVAKARAGRPRKPRNLGAAQGRAGGVARTTVRLRLRPVRRYRRELRKRGRIRGRAVVTYVASQGGRRARAVTRLVLRAGSSKSGQAGGKKRLDKRPGRSQK